MVLHCVIERFRLGAVALTVAFLFAGCGGEEAVRDLGTRAVVIGIDGADWKIIDELSAEGLMPNLARLRSEGIWGRIDTLHDIPLSPVIWTSVATGKTAEKHGIAWFMVDQPDGTRVPVRSHNRRVKAIWNILAENQKRPMVLGWWATYPAEEVGKGAVISDALGFHGFGSTARGGAPETKTYPPELFARADALVPAEQQVPVEFAQRFIHLSDDEYRNEMFDPARSPQRDPFNPIHLFQQYAVTAQGYTAIARDLLASRAFDLFLLYFEQVDSFSHLFMKYDPPHLEWVETAAFERYRDMVRNWYAYQDELLGQVLAEIDLEETAVFVLSDHGFKSGDRRIRSEETVDVKRAHLDHETHGIFLAAGPHLRLGEEIVGASVLDLTPTVLHYLGFPVAKDMDGRVLEGIFESDFMRDNPIRYLSTYEETRAEEGPTEDEAYSQEELEANRKALEALGYLGGSSGRRDTQEGDAGGEGDGTESSPEIHNGLGRIHLSKGDLAKARQEFSKALDLDPNNADALLNLASIERSEGRAGEAERLVKRALQVDPNSIAALAQLAEIKRDLGDLDEAVRLFGLALAIDDSQPSTYLGYGDVLQRAGRLDEAEQAFLRVLELDPDSFKARYNLGVTYGNQGREDEAVVMYEKALELSPDDFEAPKAHNNLGAIHLSRGETDLAMARFEQASRGSVANLESRYNLASIYLERDRVGEAVTLLEEAAAIEPNHEIVTMALGGAYMRAGRNEDAYKSFLLVRRLYPGNWEAPLRMAVLQAASDQPDQARPLLSDALRLGGQPARAQADGYPVLGELLAETDSR